MYIVDTHRRNYDGNETILYIYEMQTNDTQYQALYTIA
jgi:hypothetical protein